MITLDFTPIPPKYKWIELQWLEFEINDSLKVLRLAIDSNEDILIKRKLEHEEALKKDVDLQSLREEDKPSYIGHIYGNIDITLYQLKYVLRNASLMAISSFFENMLNQICQETHRKLRPDKHFKELNSRKAFERYTNYLKKVALVNTTKSQVIISKIRTYQRVRNKVAHTNGQGKLTNKEYEEFKYIEGLRIVNTSAFKEFPNYKWYIEVPFLMGFIELVHEYFEILLKEIDLRVEEANIRETEH